MSCSAQQKAIDACCDPAERVTMIRALRRYEYSLIDLACAVHGVVMGSHASSLTAEELDATVDVVRQRVNDWRASVGPAQAFDDGVKAMCEAAVKEYERWLVP